MRLQLNVPFLKCVEELVQGLSFEVHHSGLCSVKKAQSPEGMGYPAGSIALISLAPPATARRDLVDLGSYPHGCAQRHALLAFIRCARRYVILQNIFRHGPGTKRHLCRGSLILHPMAENRPAFIRQQITAPYLDITTINNAIPAGALSAGRR